MSMEDPNRPVTGYPAPNPHAHAHTNGYPANAPPPASAYAYGAPPPPPSGFYYAQNYQYDPVAVRQAKMIRYIFACVIGLIVAFGTAIFVLWLVLRPQVPEFQVDSFSVSNLTVGSNSLISFTSDIRLTARNPNKKMDLDYDHFTAQIFYKSDYLQQTAVPPFTQHTKNETSLEAHFAAGGSFVGKSASDGINDDRGKKGKVEFNLRMASRVKFRAKGWTTTRRILKVFCGDLEVSIPANEGSGTLNGGPKKCRVGL